ncbi:MAG: hypothetical protein KDA78_18195 [Planctomycetaceae bacterium]|nr:hypothetical protein [Planctomycetaceae bacterium]
MFTTFERQLFRQFLLVNGIYLCVILGLFTIIDLFDNVDDFVNHPDGRGVLGLVIRISSYYGRMGMFIFDSAALPMIAISALTVLLLCKRRGQIKPFLSAGIPTYRVLVPPLLLGAGVMIGLKMANRELFLGNAVHHLHASRGGGEKTLHMIAPRYDHASQILIDGWAVYPESRTIEKAAFVLPPEVAGQDMVCLRAEKATFYPRQGQRPSGWLLNQVHPPLSEIPLTEMGRMFVVASRQPENIFVVSDVSPDLIYKAKESSSFLTTVQLVDRIQSPAIDRNTARDLEFNLHSRVIEPFLTALMVWLAIPVVLQKESRGMIVNAGECGFWLFLIIGSTYAARFLPPLQVAEPVQAAWIPLFFATPITIWMLDRVES